MKIYSDKSLRNFEFWGGAEDSAAKLSYEQLDEVEKHLEAYSPEGMSEEELNDWFSEDFDTVVQWLGYESEEMFDFCNEFEDEEREIEIDGEVYTLEINHDENSTMISDNTSIEELEVESGWDVDDALKAYKEMLTEALAEESEED